MSLKTSSGKKFDSKKPRAELLPPRALLEVASVLGFGAEKYSENNWEKLENLESRYTGAALRHILALMSGEKLDPETGMPHEAHAVCCLLFILEDKIKNEERRQEKRLREPDSVEHTESYKITEPRERWLTNN